MFVQFTHMLANDDVLLKERPSPGLTFGDIFSKASTELPQL
jgi:hypothetical protein